MYIKTGRNEPCWCGSGQKYKHCHWGREREKPITKWELRQYLDKRYLEKYCLHPEASLQDCNGPIVKAHTIQRNGGLNLIASQDGHVYGFIPDGSDYVETVEQDINNIDERLPKRIGVKKASTFTGFCNKHDTLTFRPIEQFDFQSNEEHTFLLAYRAVCKSVFMKQGNVNFMDKIRHIDRGQPKLGQINTQLTLNLQRKWFEDGLEMALRHKSLYDAALTNKDYSQVKYCVLRIDQTPEIMCSGSIAPHFDFQGHIIQNPKSAFVNPQSQEHINCSIIATDNGGAIVFSWLGGKNVAKRLIHSLLLLSDHQLPYAVTRFVFEHIENVYVSPSWWDKLNPDEQSAIIRRASVPFQKKNGLKDDGLQVVTWTISSKETNIAF
ncbi:MAG TPA: SEC-C metal-binding domain-containing protein [Chloroflexota bacterium]|nr:SEC-C metal-binding domain-containing protein [Chloroflexota bacterium]HUM67431.1 SEC-C metal-binding domain-containing protein [Chloroflexota bacterium]